MVLLCKKQLSSFHLSEELRWKRKCILRIAWCVGKLRLNSEAGLVRWTPQSHQVFSQTLVFRTDDTFLKAQSWVLKNVRSNSTKITYYNAGWKFSTTCNKWIRQKRNLVGWDCTRIGLLSSFFSVTRNTFSAWANAKMATTSTNPSH